ncbi:DeoR/GlpR family DNA-binding transcription regulator [Vibrio hannami]|uniref:DeoR/GlpR family DNA-binding transcription regulator n=1 Tax=Vibrio hannami TaxID=2717094 RepID=UPI00240F2EC1|nr:DeoR/GlpR family DNA-binding transcription regulator [Vibrio hannami]MDG3085064.1 DeoR/GlpR family DNA-binding transcription regulator [Vibrio hannami]
MNVLERHESILELLEERGRIEVKDLVEIFDTSEVTIRGDLRKLEQTNKLRRYHGGAQALQTLPLVTNSNNYISLNEVTLESRYEINTSAKERIAKKAAEFARTGDSIIIDSGSTTHLVAEELAQNGGIIAITNNLAAADALKEAPDTTLVICGGTYRSKTKSLHGSKTEQCLDGVSADMLFLGADGIDPDKGITTFNEGYTISAVMAACANKIVAVVDSSKMGRVGFNRVLDIELIDVLVTDTNISKEYIKKFQAKGIEVVLV